MTFKCLLLLILKHAFLLLVFFLPLNNTEEIVALSLGLLSHHLLTLHKLSAASNIHVFCLLLGLLTLKDFLSALLAVTLFTGTFGSEGINLCLTVSSLLLHLTETGNFGLLLKSNTTLLFGFGSFTRNFILIVTDNFHVFIHLHLSHLGLLCEGYLISSLNLSDQFCVPLAFFLSLSNLFLFLLLKHAHHLLLLLNKQLTLSDAFVLTFLDLVNDYGGTLALSLDALNLTLLSHFEALETLDFHHEIQAFLLFAPLFFENLVLFDLFIADSNNFTV